MARARVGKWIAFGLGGLLVLVTGAVLAANIVLQGERLGSFVTGVLPKKRGKLILGGIHWRLRAIADLVTDTPSPVVIDGLKIVDPEGTLVLDVPHLTADVPLRSLIGGNIAIHNLKVGKSSWRFGKMKDGSAVGFTAALADPPRPKKPEPDKRKDSGGGGYFRIVNADLDGLTAVFDFPAWGLELRDIKGPCWLEVGVRKALPVGYDCGPLDARTGGYLRILADNVLPFDRVLVRRVATTAEWNDDIFLDVRGAKTGRSTLTGKGFFTGIYGDESVPGIKMHAEFDDAADALSSVGSAKVPGLAVGGSGAKVKADLHETFEKLKIQAAFRGLDISFGAYRARKLGLDFGFVASPLEVAAQKLSFEPPGGGRLALDALLRGPPDPEKKPQDTSLDLRADLRFEGFTTDSYLPPSARPLGAGTLTGKLHAEADLDKLSGGVRGLDLTLRRSRRGRLPPQIRIHGEAGGSKALVKTSGITVDVPGASARAAGQMLLARREVEIGLGLVAHDLARVLQTLGLPALARSAKVDVDVAGSIKDPTASGSVSAAGLDLRGIILPALEAKFGLRGGTASLDQVKLPLWGGEIDAHGKLKLWSGSTARMLRQPVIEAEVEGRGLSLAGLVTMVAALVEMPDLPKQLAADGSLDFHATAVGPANKLRARFQIPGGTRLRLLGEGIDLGPIDVEMQGKDVVIHGVRVARSSGGSVEITGRMALGGAMAIDLTVDRISLGGLSAPDLGLSGFVSAALHVAGTAAKPVVSGDIRLAAIDAKGLALGDGQISILTTPQGALTAAGDLFGRFHVEALASLGPRGPAVHAAISFAKLQIHDLAADLKDQGGRASASGTVTVDVRPGAPLAIDARVTELAASLGRETELPSGEITTEQVTVRNAGDLHVSVVGERLTLDPVRLETDGGEVALSGRLDAPAHAGGPRAFAADVAGHLDLEILQPLMRDSLRSASGDMNVRLSAAGAIFPKEEGPARPSPVELGSLQGEIAIQHPVRLRPVAVDADIAISSGAIRVSKDVLRLSDLGVSVEGATMRIDGETRLDASFRPVAFDVDVSGDVSARVLELGAPEAISDATGKARVVAHLGGTPQRPDVSARLDLGRVAFRLRGPGRDVEVRSGVVQVDNGGIRLHEVRARVDDEGSLIVGAAGIAPGIVRFNRVGPLFGGGPPIRVGEISLPLHGEGLTFRRPGSVEIDDLTFDLELAGDLAELDRDPADTFQLSGDVRLVSGRYTQDFSVKDQVIRPRINESEVRPFYQGEGALDRAIQGLGLDLRVRTVGDAFVVQNNLAPEIHLAIDVHVAGTLTDPRISGDVRPTDGIFRIIGIRGEFELVPNVNHVTFVETKSIPAGETPELNLEATNLVTDSAGNERVVHLRISGPIGQAQIDLFSEDGLDRNQVALLLLSGRTSEDASRFGTTNPTVGANVGMGADVAGQITRDTLDNLMRPYINDALERALGISNLDLRLTIGPDGFETRLGYRISRYLRTQGSALRGFQNQQQYRLVGTQWLMDYLSLNLGADYFVLAPQEGLTETVGPNAKLEFTLDYPLRGAFGK